jgi:hypothetical protein
MADKPRPYEELTQMETLLRSLAVSESGLDRDRLMYLAGHAAAEAEWQSRRVTPTLWRRAAVLSTAVAIVLAATLALTLALRPEPHAIRLTEHVDQVVPAVPKTVNKDVAEHVSEEHGNEEDPEALVSDEPVVTATADAVDDVDDVDDDFWPDFRRSNELPATASYLQLRRFVLSRGIEAWPLPVASNGPASVEPIVEPPDDWRVTTGMLRGIGRFNRAWGSTPGVFDWDRLLELGENL